MTGFGDDRKVPIYGDGSFTTPKKWWSALGGFGIWIPEWNQEDEGDDRQQQLQQKDARAESNVTGPALGQTGSSTRMELMAWLKVLPMPVRSMYATDSACMLGKAKKLIQAAEREEGQGKGPKGYNRNPFKKPWGLQTDGDLWEQAWPAILTRGAANQDLRKAKGHATVGDVGTGRSNPEDKHGNDKSDKNADKESNR